jgi:hypothetical protein
MASDYFSLKLLLPFRWLERNLFYRQNDIVGSVILFSGYFSLVLALRLFPRCKPCI